MMLVDPYRFRGSSPATISYEGSATSGAATATQTITLVPIGAANNFKTAIQVISWTGATGITLNSATIGGVAADIVQFSALHALTVFGYVAIISADVPTGTTATTVVNFSTAVIPVTVESFQAIGLISKTATDTDTATIFGPTTGTVSPDVLAGGVIVAAVTARVAGSFTITGATETYDATIGVNLQIAGGSYTTPTAELAHAVTFVSATYSGPILGAAFR